MYVILKSYSHEQTINQQVALDLKKKKKSFKLLK